MTTFMKALARLLTWPFRHWRRTGLIIGILLVTLALAYTIADQILLHTLDAQRQRMKQLGVPLSYADFGLEQDQIHDQDNAAYIYNYIGYKILQHELDWLLFDRIAAGLTPMPEDSLEDSDKPLTPEEFEKVKSQMEALRPSLEMVREVLPLKTCIFGNYVVTPAAAGTPSTIMPTITRIRRLCRHLAEMAVLQYRLGNVDEAYEWIALGLHVANDFRHEPLLMSGFVRAACAGIALDALHVMLYNGDLPATVPPAIMEELAVLTDRSWLKRMMYGERCFSEAYEEVLLPYISRCSRPRHVLERLRLNDLSMCLATAIATEDAKTRQRLLEPLNEYTKGPVWLYGSVAILAPVLRQAVTHFDQVVARAQMAALTLALKEYKQQHGNYPDALAELVPAHMPEVPKDPASGDDYAYQRAGEGFTLCSVWKHPTRKTDRNPTCGDTAPSGLCVCVIK